MSASLGFLTSAALFTAGKLGGTVLPFGWWPCWLLLGAAAVSLYLELWLRNLEGRA